MRVAQAVVPTAPDGAGQVMYYDEGVGNDWSMLARLSGGAFGAGLSRNVQKAYHFVIDNYEEGDELYLFGFSRGAFTARSTAGLIRKCGLLKKQYGHLAEQAFGIYRHRSDDKDPRKRGPDSQEAIEFRDQYSRRISIDFLGVWDTVGALGVPIFGPRSLIARKRWSFHDMVLSRSVRNACHALSIDERRRAFKPAIWDYRSVPGQHVEQVWFAGVHSDVGGGYKESGLSDITFLWMVERAQRVGLAFDMENLSAGGLSPKPNEFGELHDSMDLFFRLAMPVSREIGEPPQQVHVSAKSRYQRESFDYHPANLERYFAKYPEEQHWEEPPGATVAVPGQLPAPPTEDRVEELEDAALG
jgi:uncharacterized protein (DUF2235 family)